MVLHLAELGRVETPGLEQDRVADAQLSHVVEEGALEERAHLGAGEARRLPDARGVDGDAEVVGVGVAVSLRDGAAHHAKRLEVGVEQAQGQVLQPAQQAGDDGVDERGGGEDDPDPQSDGAGEPASRIGPLLRRYLEPGVHVPGDASRRVAQGDDHGDEPLRAADRATRIGDASDLHSGSILDGQDDEAAAGRRGRGSLHAVENALDGGMIGQSSIELFQHGKSQHRRALGGPVGGQFLRPSALSAGHHHRGDGRDRQGRDRQPQQEHPLDGTVSRHAGSRPR